MNQGDLSKRKEPRGEEQEHQNRETKRREGSPQEKIVYFITECLAPRYLDASHSVLNVIDRYENWATGLLTALKYEARRPY